MRVGSTDRDALIGPLLPEVYQPLVDLRVAKSSSKGLTPPVDFSDWVGEM